MRRFLAEIAEKWQNIFLTNGTIILVFLYLFDPYSIYILCILTSCYVYLHGFFRPKSLFEPRQALGFFQGNK